MRRLACGLVGSLALAAGVLAQEAPPSSLTPAQAREDLAVLKRGLEEMHGGLYRFSTPSDITARFATMAAALDSPISIVDFYGRILEAAAWPRDGHIQVAESDAVNAAVMTVPLLPLRFLVEDDHRLVVLYSDSGDDSPIEPGTEVVAINGRAARDVLATMLPTLTHDGHIETRRKLTIGRSFGAFYWLVVDRAATFDVTVRTPTGGESVVRLAGLRASDRKPHPINARITANLAMLDGPRDNVHLDWIDDGRIAKLRIRRFEGDTFPDELASAFTQLGTRGTKSLIIDLRGNPGGIDEHGMQLLSHLVSKPFQYFERIHIRTVHPSFATWSAEAVAALRDGVRPAPEGGFVLTAQRHPGLADTAPAAVRFNGSLYVLIDGGTFSTASDAAAHIRDLTTATFIGDETGGTYEGNTSGPSAELTLPHSRFRVRMSLYGYYSRVTPPAIPGRGVLPDHAAPRRVADVIADRDGALDLALDLARTGRR